MFTGCCIRVTGTHYARKVEGICCQVLLSLLILGCLEPIVGDDHPDGNWPMGGQNIHNTRYAAAESEIGPEAAGSLAVKWVFNTRRFCNANRPGEGALLSRSEWKSLQD
jgi:hypothetical protein